MDWNQQLHYEARKKITYISNLDSNDYKNNEALIYYIIWLFKYIFDIVVIRKVDIKDVEEIKTLVEIIDSKFEFFKHTFLKCRRSSKITCFEALKMRSGIRFLIDDLSSANENLRKKLEELDLYLDNHTKRWPNLVECYYINEELMEEDIECVDLYSHAIVEHILKMRGVPKSHYWWPDFCRNSHLEN
ncbi:hypothetical protein DMUE_3872 [Dictyocoela muelleri]|nr:hypothetical protein DMUE_3872 [Dictyocoela muelleri]